MATGPDPAEAIRGALQEKSIALSRYLQELLVRESEDPERIRIAFARGKIELELTFALLSDLGLGRPVDIPDPATIVSLRHSVAVLAQAIVDRAEPARLVAAADQVIAIWPN